MAKKTTTVNGNVWTAVAVGRIMLGVVFLWAFFDKLVGLGMATPTARAWVNGGSPTTGFLKNVEGPFAEFFNGMAGSGLADFMFMAGLFGIGVGLIAGVAVRLAAVAGGVMLMLMWAASLPLENNPVIDDHVVYTVFLAVIALGLPQQKWDLQTWWRNLPVVKENSWLW